MSNKTLSKLKRVASGMIKDGRKKGETPEGSVLATPTTSIESVTQEKEHYIDLPLDNEEIAALNVQENDLIRLHPPRPTSAEIPFQHNKKKVLVRNEPVPTTAVDRQKRKVRVLRPLPPGTAIPAEEQLILAPPGPRFEKDGTFVAHSILGKAEDFASELKQKKLISSTSDFTRSPPIIEPKIPKLTTQVEMMSGIENPAPPREKHALGRWTETMSQRRAQQNLIAGRVDSFPENLAMNQGDTFREFQEERVLIDRAIPALEDGKGYRTGSEFWRQQVRLGDEETGIHITHTKTEKGFPPEVEYVGVPSVVRKEKGIDMDSTRNATVPYTRRQMATYLMERRDELRETITDIEHFRPSFSELQVIGHAIGAPAGDSAESVVEPTQSSRFRFRTDSLDSQGEEKSEKDQESSTARTNDTEEEPSKGPALIVADNHLQWMGPPLPPARRTPTPPLVNRESKSDSTLRGSAKWAWRQRDKGRGSAKELSRPKTGLLAETIKCRVLLECATGEISTSHLHMENCGSTTVYYSWEFVAKRNPLGTVQSGNRQRFYFDTRGGVLLPGEQLEFPFHFKSPNPGIFSEMWLLSTAPVLNRGRPLVVTLKGVACQDDLHKDKREEIERILVHREAVAAAERIMDRLVNSIRTPPSSPPRKETIKTEEDIFKEKNPEVFFHYNVVQQLRNLHDVALYPEYFQECVTPTSLTAKGEKGTGGKKGDEKSGGAKRGGAGGSGATSKEKRGLKPKEELEVVVNTLPEPPADLTKWDLSISSLLKVIMGVEDENSREEKLKQLNRLVGELSFPPLPPVRKSPYYACYLCLCEAMDTISDISTHLCHVMGLQPRDWGYRGDPRGSGEDHNVLSVPGSPAHGRAKADKRASVIKDKKEGKKGNKDRMATPTHRKKSVKTPTSPKGRGSELNEVIREAASASDVDSVLELKYKENFYTSVYRILEMAVEKMVVLIESEKTD